MSGLWFAPAGTGLPIVVDDGPVTLDENGVTVWQKVEGVTE